MTAIDLTLLIDEQSPTTWPQHVPFVRRTWNWFEPTTHGPEAWTSNCGPYFAEVLVLDEHIATHFDAPGHFVAEHAPGNERTIGGDEIPVETFCGSAVVLLRTDWDAKYYRAGPAGSAYAYDVAVTKTAPGWPAPNVECAELLLGRGGVRCFGTDGTSMGAVHDGVPVHGTGLGGGMVPSEELANLASVPEDGVHFQFLPIKIARSSGGPGRAIAGLGSE